MARASSDRDVNPEIANEGLRLVTLRLREGDIVLTVTQPEAVVPVFVDSTQIKQVLVNLVLNAVDAMEPVATKTLSVRLKADAKRTVLEVEDSGLGIADEHLARIFDPFFTTKAPDKGTGLGLSVCAAIVKQHCGDLTVRSQPGIGTTFVVSLPVRARRERAPDPLVARPAVTGAFDASSVLVVDDDAPVAAFVRRALQSHLSCEVEVAQDGGVAILRLQERRFSLVLSDVRMPRVNGVELLDWVAAHQPERARRVAFMTGDTGDSALNARLSGLDTPVIRKPFTLTVLVDHVASLLHHLGPDVVARV